MKHIIVTGTSSGIGFETVKLLIQEGHKVLALSRNSKPISDLKLVGCTCFSFDITLVEDLSKVSEFIDNNWGHVDVLINNSGVLINKPFKETSYDDFLKVYNVNVFGIAALIQKILPYLPKNGHVVNISSIGGIQGSLKFPGLSAYSSSKGALITLTELLAEEYKETGPSFNALALGAVQTEMLDEAFPGYRAPLSAIDMAKYIANFSIEGNQHYNGKVLQVSNSTP